MKTSKTMIVLTIVYAIIWYLVYYVIDSIRWKIL